MNIMFIISHFIEYLLQSTQKNINTFISGGSVLQFIAIHIYKFVHLVTVCVSGGSAFCSGSADSLHTTSHCQEHENLPVWGDRVVT